MQWMLPKARFRTEDYFSPVNLALVLMLLKLVVVPALIITVGAESRLVLFPLPSMRSMEGAIAVDLLAYVALCLGLSFTPARRSGGPVLLPSPSPVFVAIFMGLGLIGFVAAFGSVGRMFQYFVEPSAVSDIQKELDGTIWGLMGTFLRPFLAFSLVAWWSGIADHNRGLWRVTLAGLLTAIGITIANLTFSFNRAAFVFPLVTLAAVYSSRIRRVQAAWAVAVAALALPLLMIVSVYRSNLMRGHETAADDAIQSVAQDASETIQAYTVGPQYTGTFYDYVGWGRHLYGGSTLVASALSPVPVLGKGFRETNGPALFNRSIYGIAGIEDQILPFNAELFANFHGVGVLAGFIGLGILLVKFEHWFQTSASTFSAFALQYAAMWTAMLAAWSLSIYAQILIYFFGPIYLYVAASHCREWLRIATRPSPRWGNAQ
jgi:hypothetical protein